MNRNDFELLNKNIVYFDNGATTLKPKCVKEAIYNYYTDIPLMHIEEIIVI